MASNGVNGHLHHSNTSNNGWLFDIDLPYVVPSEIVVGLLGFDGDGYQDYRIDSHALQRYLQNSLESYIPACVEAREHMNVQFDISYNIVKVGSSHLKHFEEALSRGMQFFAKRTEDSFYYDVDVGAVTSVLDEVYLSMIGAEKHKNVIIVINPNAHRMKPPKVDGKLPRDWTYRYRYAGGTPTQTWIARERYVVLDLGAGPCEFGVTNAGEGTVSVDSVPNLDRINEKEMPRHLLEDGATVTNDDAHELSTHIKFLAQLSSLLLAAVRHVFLPDMRFRNIEQAEKVIMPVMVFRNHDRFNPLQDADSPFFIDMDAISNELKALMGPKQELVIPTGVYSLHEHRQIATALFRSLRGDSIHTATPSGHYVAKTISYFDSAVLIDELSRTEDFLTRAFMDTDATELTGHHSSGHRVIPVYVFSVLGFPNDLLLDRQVLHMAAKECVIVLQTGSEAIFVPYFNEEGVLSLDARRATRQVLAGAVTSLGGVMNPYQRYVSKDHEIVSDYLWANGHHPFGPFTRTNGLSKIYTDIVRRNTILSRVTSSFRLVRQALNAWDEFTREYLFNPLGDTIEYNTLSPMQLMANKLQFWHAQDYGVAPLSQVVMARLLEETASLEKQFSRLAELLRSNSWNDADELSSVLEKAAEGFVTYATDEIASARRSLRCCKRIHQVNRGSAENQNRYAKWLFIAVCGIGVFVLVQSCVGSQQTTASSRSGLSRTRRY